MQSQITPYGAVFGDSGLPTPMESYDYFQKQKAQKKAMELKKQELEAEARDKADKRFADVIKPLQDFKVNTGFTSITPDAITNQRLLEAQKKAAAMYKAGKPDSEVNLFVQESVRETDAFHNHLKNTLGSLNEQLKMIDKNELDHGQLRQLAEVELLNSQPGDDPNGVLQRVLTKYADAIHPINRAGLFQVKPDNKYQNFHKSIRFADGSRGSGDVVGEYSSLYQEVKPDKDGNFNVVTKAVPAMINGEPVTGLDGKPVMVLPTEAYLDLNSKSGRYVEIEKRTKQMMAEEMDQRQALADREASDILNVRYGTSLLKMPWAQRRNLREKETERILKLNPINEELIRQQAAYKIADENIPKSQVQLHRRRDPDKPVAGSGGSGGSGNGQGGQQFYNAYADVVNESRRTGNSRVPLHSVGGTAAGVILNYIQDAYGEKPAPAGVFGAKPVPYSEDDLEVVLNQDGSLTVLINGVPKKKLTEYDINAKANPTAQYARKPIIAEGSKGQQRVFVGLDENDNPIFK